MPEQMNKSCWMQYCRNKSDVLVQQIHNKYTFPICARHATVEYMESLDFYFFEEQRVAAEVAERLTNGS